MKKLGFGEEVELVNRNICSFCKEPAGCFRNAISAKEYRISGLCQSCQDEVFGQEE
jgi:hypothetical protein